MGRRSRLAVLALLSTAGALVAVECVVRLWIAFVPARSRRGDRPTFFYAPERGLTLSDWTYLRAKRPGTFRIAAVGDSFTYPYDLQFDDTYSKRLERMLNLPTAPASKVEVLNFGEIGANSAGEVATVGKALDFGPDLVILQITLNDPTPPKMAPDEIGDYLRMFLPFDSTPAVHPILSHWKTFVFLATRVHAARMRPAYDAFHRRLFENPGSWKGFADSVSAMKEQCAMRGVRFAAVIFPMLVDLDEHYPFTSIHQRIVSFLETLQVPVHDLLPAFMGMAPERLHTRVGIDEHPNEIAHRIAAEHIYLWLERERLIPPALVLKRKYSSRDLIPKPFTDTDDGQ